MSVLLTKYNFLIYSFHMKHEILQNIGLSEKAAAIYVAALSLGTASIQDLAIHAKVKRPTAYLHTEELIREGLLEKIPLGKKEYYQAVDPSVLESRAEEQMFSIKKIIPDLRSLQSDIQGKPQISIMEGKKALEEIYREISTVNAIRFWSDLSAVEAYFQDAYIKIAEGVNDNEIRCREIIADTPEARKSSKRYAATAGKTYSSRIATKSPGIQNDSAIFGDTLALFRIHRFNLFVILIKEPTIASTMKTIFDMAWESATPFIGR